VAFSSPEQAERLVKAWSGAEGSRSLVRRNGSVALLLDNVAPERADELMTAAAAAFR
jgi:hypothetical protein